MNAMRKMAVKAGLSRFVGHIKFETAVTTITQNADKSLFKRKVSSYLPVGQLTLITVDVYLGIFRLGRVEFFLTNRPQLNGRYIANIALEERLDNFLNLHSFLNGGMGGFEDIVSNVENFIKDFSCEVANVK